MRKEKKEEMVSLILVVFFVLFGLTTAAGWLAFAYLTIPSFFRLLATIPIRLGRR